MERLQAAIEKARQQRDQSQEGAAPRARKAASSDTAPSPEMVAATLQLDQTEHWRALEPLDASGLMRSNSQQIVTLRPGSDAIAYDILRTRIVQQAQANGWKRVAVTSPHSGCGKTLTVANLAFSFGRQSDMRTMIFDFDMRRATLARTLGQLPSHNMGDLLEGRIPFADYGRRHGSNVAFALSSGPVANPSELLQSNAGREALAAIEASYAPDIVLFDVPPLRATDDSIGFLRFVDAAVIIVAAEETPMSQIDIAERQVAELTNVMGVVLNKCRMHNGDYGYEDYSA
jgi:protein-tyrosine kinase